MFSIENYGKLEKSAILIEVDNLNNGCSLFIFVEEMLSATNYGKPL